MAINILIIDDDKRPVTRLVSNLRRADTGNVLGTIEVDDSIVQLDMVEKYDTSKFNTTFDIALIDYQLTSTFTGILISAWIALHLRIPRMALSTAAYPGDPSYFNGAILKKEITDSPAAVIQHIVDCVETYNSDEWLNNQHKVLVEQYHSLLQANNNVPQLAQIEGLLDRFERVLDAQQDTEIKKILAYEQQTGAYQQKTCDFDKRFADLSLQLRKYQEELNSD